jgi:rubrerythrin
MNIHSDTVFICDDCYKAISARGFLLWVLTAFGNIKNEPCPLCGSTSAEHWVNLGELLRILGEILYKRDVL